MLSEVLKHAAQVRCSECGRTAVVSVCHHCGRPLCAEHSRSIKDPSGRLQSVEFAQLGLDSTPCGEDPVHCEICFHVVRAPTLTWIVLGTALCLVAVLVFARSFLAGYIMVVAGLFLVVSGYLINRHRREHIMKSRPPIPLLPRFDPIQIREVVAGQIRLLDDGNYHSSMLSPTGTITATAKFGRSERDILKNYKHRFQLDKTKEMMFHIGFICLQGRLSLESIFDERGLANSGHVIAMTDAARPQIFHSKGSDGEAGKWSRVYRYELSRGARDSSLPVRLVPSLMKETALRGLYIELQWDELRPGLEKSALYLVEALEIRVPVEWGEVESTMGPALVSKVTESSEMDGTTWRTITWKNVPIANPKERRERRRTFFARFENDIDLTSAIHGQLALSFKDALSGIESTAHYYPLGGRRQAEAADVRTQVVADFQLSLASLRHQKTRVVPDEKSDEEHGRKATTTFEGVMPDHETVTALTNAMSDQDFYVKRILENPPRQGGSAEVITRVWDIAGRRYIGVYPIDFHLILSGEERYSGETRGPSGSTRVELKVLGTYSSRSMESQIESVWVQLDHLTRSTLEKLRREVPVKMPLQELRPDQDFWQPAPRDEGRRLRNRLEMLMDVVIDALLPEGVFVEIKEALEQKLSEIKGQAYVSQSGGR